MFQVGKAPGSDGNSIRFDEVLEDPFLLPLYEELLQCWTEEAVPHDTKDVKIVTLYKTKAREVTVTITVTLLLRILGRVFVRVLLVRLKKIC